MRKVSVLAAHKTRAGMVCLERGDTLGGGGREGGRETKSLCPRKRRGRILRWARRGVVGLLKVSSTARRGLERQRRGINGPRWGLEVPWRE